MQPPIFSGEDPSLLTLEGEIKNRHPEGDEAESSTGAKLDQVDLDTGWEVVAWAQSVWEILKRCKVRLQGRDGPEQGLALSGPWRTS